MGDLTLETEDAGKVVHRVNWGNPCCKKRNSDRYLNLRAAGHAPGGAGGEGGRLSVLTQNYRNVLLNQSSRIPKSFTDKGRIRVPPKGSVEWDGLSSPDLLDAICYVFLMVRQIGESPKLLILQTRKGLPLE